MEWLVVRGVDKSPQVLGPQTSLCLSVQATPVTTRHLAHPRGAYGQSHPSPVNPVPISLSDVMAGIGSLRLPPVPISNDLKALGGRTNSLSHA